LRLWSSCLQLLQQFEAVEQSDTAARLWNNRLQLVQRIKAVQLFYICCSRSRLQSSWLQQRQWIKVVVE
jgi:hypothetical protein